MLSIAATILCVTSTAAPTILEAGFAARKAAQDSTSYEDPATGCSSDEHVTTMAGVPGSWCAPSCVPLVKPCPSNMPQGVHAIPFCSVPANASASTTSTASPSPLNLKSMKSCALRCLPVIAGCGEEMECHGFINDTTVEGPDGLTWGVCSYV